jgi:hypothetical protein
MQNTLVNIFPLSLIPLLHDLKLYLSPHFSPLTSHFSLLTFSLPPSLDRNGYPAAGDEKKGIMPGKTPARGV